MSNVMTRICPYCNTANPAHERQCVHCNADLEANLPAVRPAALPSLVAGVALPILARLAIPVLRASFQLLRQALQSRPAAAIQVIANPTPEPADQGRLQAVIRMRGSWVVRNADGTETSGQQEATWELYQK